MEASRKRGIKLNLSLNGCLTKGEKGVVRSVLRIEGDDTRGYSFSLLGGGNPDAGYPCVLCG